MSKNTSHLQGLRYFDPILTNMVMGYGQHELIWNKILPTVNVPTDSFQVPSFGKDALRVFDSDRPLYGRAPVIETGEPTLQTISVSEHSVRSLADVREIKGSAAALSKQALYEHKARVVKSSLENEREVAAAALIQNASNYPANNKVTLSGGDQFTHADADPLDVLADALKQVKGAGQGRASDIVFSDDSWDSFARHARVKSALIHTAETGLVTPELLAKYLNVRIHVGSATTYNAETDTTTNIWGDNVIVARVESTPGERNSPYTAAFGKTFIQDEIAIQRYDDDPSGKVKAIEGTTTWAMALLKSDLGYLISDTNA